MDCPEQTWKLVYTSCSSWVFLNEIFWGLKLNFIKLNWDGSKYNQTTYMMKYHRGFCDLGERLFLVVLNNLYRFCFTLSTSYILDFPLLAAQLQVYKYLSTFVTVLHLLNTTTTAVISVSIYCCREPVTCRTGSAGAVWERLLHQEDSFCCLYFFRAAHIFKFICITSCCSIRLAFTHYADVMFN